MRRLNVRLALWLLGCAAVLGLLFFVTHWLQTGRIASALLWQAQHAEEQGNLDDAGKYLARYVEFVPTDTEQMANLGRVLVSDKKATSRGKQKALFVLEQVLIREPDRHDSRRLLVRAALDVGRADLALEHLDKLEKALPDDAGVRFLQGESYVAQQKYREAATAFRKATEVDPSHLDSYRALASLLRDRAEQVGQALKDLDADKVMDECVAKNPKNHQAYLARWGHRIRTGKVQTGDVSDEAAGDVTEALKLAPEDAEVLLAAGRLYQYKKEFAEARSYLARGQKLFPENYRFYQAQARVELEAGEGSRDKAIAALEEGIAALPSRAELLWDVANLLLDDGKEEKAREHINRLGKLNASPEAMDYLQARVHMHHKEWAEAVRRLQRSRPAIERESPELSKEADLLLAQCYGRLDEPAQQQAAYQRAIGRDPRAASARMGLAANLWAAGRVNPAIDEMRQALAQPGAPASGWADLSRMLLIRNLHRGVNANWEEVTDAIDRAEKAGHDRTETDLLRAEVLKGQNKLDEARKLLIAARDRDPKRVEPWAGLASLFEAEKKPEEAARLLAEAEKQTGDVVKLRIAKSRYWASQKGETSARAIAALAQGAEKFTPADRALLYRGLTEAYSELGMFKEAEAAWARLTAIPEQAGDLRVHLVLFDLALRANDDAALPKVLDDVKKLEGPKGILWKHGEAVRIIRQAKETKDNGKLSEAQALLDEVVVQRPTWPQGHLARAELETLQNRTEQAVADYREAMVLGERNPQVVRKLVELLHQQRRYSEAEAALQELGRQTVLPPELQRLAADLSMRKQDYNQAREYLAAVAENSQDYRDHLWLGQVLSASGKAAEAEEKLRRAVELGPDKPETWVALVRHLAAGDQTDDAEKAIADAQAKLPAELRAVALAQCYEATGNRDRAYEQYRAAVKARPDDVAVQRNAANFYLRTNRLAEAEPILRLIAGKKLSSATEADLAWARYGLAMVVSAREDQTSFAEALGLVGLSLTASGLPFDPKKTTPTAEELRGRARVLATRKLQVCRAMALDCLKELDRQKAFTSDDKFLLAQLLEADGNVMKAREEFTTLVATQRSSPVYLFAFVQFLIRNRDAAEAGRWVEQLEALEKKLKGDFGSVELRVEVLEAKGEGKKAVDLLKARVESKSARPDNLMQLIALLARQNRVNEALDLCERAWEKAPPEVAGAVSMSVLRLGKPTPEQIDRVRKKIEEASKKDTKGVMFLLQLADMEDLQCRLPEAEKMYRAVLTRDPNNPIALNNLAWLLSQKPGGGNEALPLIERALARGGPRPEFLDTRSTVFLALGKTTAAIEDLKQANKDAPSPSREFRLAFAYHAAHDHDAAVAALKKAKSDGLKPEQLHPVEQLAYRKVADELKQ